MRFVYRRATAVLGALTFVVPPILATLTASFLSLHSPLTAKANTYGNTDQYESTDYPHAAGYSAPTQTTATSPIWNSVSLAVNQRYGCTDAPQETPITGSSPTWTQVCNSLPCPDALGNCWHYWHHGIDINLNSGTALYSPVSGVVADYSAYYAAFGIRDLSGRIVYLLHGYPYNGLGVGNLVTVAQHVVDSDNAGCPGCTTGPHLHLEVHSSKVGVGGSDPGFWDDINPEAWLQYQGPHAATVSWGSSRLDLFVRGTGGDAYWRYFDGTNWHPPTWQPLGRPSTTYFAGQLAAASWGTSRIDLFGVGTDGNLWQNYTNDGSNWSGWNSLGHYLNASLIGTPAAASWAWGDLSVFARGMDGALYHAYYSYGAPNFTWETHGGYATADPTDTSAGTNRLDVFVLGDGAHSGHTYHQWWTSTSGWQPVGNPCTVCGWEDWGNAPNGSNFASQPTSGSYGTSTIDAWAPAADGNLYTRHFGGSSWTAWQMVGNPGPSIIGAVGPSDFVLLNSEATSAFARGSDSAAYVCWWLSPSCSWDTTQGGLLTNDPVTISITGQRLDVFVRGSAASGFAVYHKVFTYSNGWSAWESFGGTMT